MSRLKLFFVVMCVNFMVCRMWSQEVEIDTIYTQVGGLGIKSNILYDATTTLNLGIEFRLSKRLSLDIPFNYNPWTFSGNKKIKHWLAQPELRYWMKESFKGSFWGLHAHGAQFNTAKIINKYRYQGWLAGAGISYGYRWNFSSRWGMEATIGVGYAYIDYTKYASEGTTPDGCGACGQKLLSDKKNYWGPTKVGLSLIYTIGGKTKKGIVPKSVAVTPVETAPPVTETVLPALAAKTDTVAVQPQLHYRHVEGSACVLFPLNQYTLLPDFKRNSEELAVIEKSVNAVHAIEGAKIVNITIEAYASPEGDLNHNIELSTNRAVALKDYMVETYGLDADSFVVRSRGENWEGLRASIAEDSSLTEKEKSDILRILDIQDPATRKMLLKTYNKGKLYTYLLQEVFPDLRISEYRIDYTVPAN